VVYCTPLARYVGPVDGFEAIEAVQSSGPALPAALVGNLVSFAEVLAALETQV
jgi:hypothetical protein